MTILVFKTDNPGATSATQIKLPTSINGNYDFSVDWGDGTTDASITSWDAPETTHTYSIAGTYTVTITGIFNGVSWINSPNGVIQVSDSAKLVGIDSWAGLGLGTGGACFANCTNLTITATDTPDLTGVTTLAYLFANCSSLTDIPNINSWDVSAVTNFTGMFLGSELFNSDIGSWDTSSALTFFSMFKGAASFNQSLNLWQTGLVERMDSMFQDATTFNGQIDQWDVSSVRVFQNMFFKATAFNQDLSAWNVASAGNMFRMFRDSNFTSNVNDWAIDDAYEIEEILTNTNMPPAVFNSIRSLWIAKMARSGIKFGEWSV